MLVGITGLLLILPAVQSRFQALVFLFILITLDVLVFALYGGALIRRRILTPVDAVIESAERISEGDYMRRVAGGETQEMHRLGEALNRMAERLIADQAELAANIRSLDETNQLLTEARDAMVRAEKLASAGRLAAGIAHEVGNPLGAIIGYLGLIGRHVPDAQKDLVSSAEREAHRIDRIVRGLLDYSRPHQAHTLPLDINSVIRETVELVSTQGRFSVVDLQLDLQADLPPVTCDPYQLQQVLVNLFVNAADALGDKGGASIIVSTFSRPARGKPQVQARRKDDSPAINYSHRRRLWAAASQGDPAPAGEPVVEVCVRDNGPGIPEEMVATIFEPFVTTKEPGKGTGLGLAVCARLIDGMGGVIRAENVYPGAGAQFSIVLPPAALPQHSSAL